MAEKFSIYAGPPMAAVLVGYEASRSARINQVCDEYVQLVKAACPALTKPQWLAVIDGLQGVFIDDDTTLKFMWAEISELPALGEKWEIDHTALVAKIKALGAGELIALREVIRCYRQCEEAYSADQSLALCGAKVVGAEDAAAH